jgi:hypothetical protein
MPQLKTRDGTPRPEPTCHKLGGSQLGANFELPDKTQLFCPLLVLIGHHLETIFSLLKQHNLDFARRSGAHNPCRNEIEITQILFADAEATPFKG